MSETPDPEYHAGSEQLPYQQPHQPPYQQPYPAYSHPAESSQTDRNWASASHWGSLVAAWLAMGFLAPLIIMLTVGNQSPFVRKHAVESLNFQISLLIYSGVAILFSILTLGIGLIVVLPVGLVAIVAALVFLIQGSIKAANGQDYRYPLTLRFVS
jgi:uncharacterized protein